MRRSLLFMPGNNPAMLQNSDVFDCDAVIYDLEDAVSITEKDAARILVSQFLKTQNNPPMEIVVRINGLDTEFWKKDLDAVVSDKIDTIMLPKAQINSLFELDKYLTQLEKSRNMNKKIAVLPIIEMAVSVLQIDNIACAPRVNGILLGAEDLSSDLEVTRTKQGDEILYPREKLVCACAAFKIDSIDTPFTDVNDIDGLIADCQFVKGIGFTSKAAIHPNQVPVINSVFVPTAKNIEWAMRVEKASYQAKEKGLGVFSLDGKMVDKPVMDRAHKILVKARKYNLVEEE